MRHVEDPVLPEPTRRGETTGDCSTCQSADDHFVWNDDRWRVSMSEEPLSLPAAVLHSRDHLDFDVLTDRLAGEMGVLLIRIQRALAAIEGVGAFTCINGAMAGRTCTSSWWHGHWG